MFTLTYHPERWRQRGSQLYQWVGRLLDPQRLLLAEVIYEPGVTRAFVSHVGVYAPRVNSNEKQWDLMYEIPSAVLTLVAASER